jgi:hypothetical protein
MPRSRTSRRPRTVRLLAAIAVALGLLATACGSSPTADGAADADADATSTTDSDADGDAADPSDNEVVVHLDGPGFDAPQPPANPPVPLDEGGADGHDESPNTDEDFEVQLNPAIKLGPPVMLAPGMDPGCTVQCITKAWLTSIGHSPDVDIEIVTNTPAKLHVSVGTSSPVVIADQLVLQNPVVVEVNDAFATTWSTRLGPLDPSTKHYILVRAEDANGHRAQRSGSFTTTSGGPSGGFSADHSLGGCGTQCITKAWATSVPGSSDLELEVDTTHDAAIEVWASTAAPTYGQLPNGKVFPTYPAVTPTASTNGQRQSSFATTLTGLAEDTFHTILVHATDSDGRRSFRIGSVRTGFDTKTVQVTFHDVWVHHQPRESIELWFDVDGADGTSVYPTGQMTTGLVDLGSPGTIKLSTENGGFRYFVSDFTGPYHPLVQVQGYARNDGGQWNCPPVVGIRSQLDGYILDDCDTTWSTAASGIGGTMDDLEDCMALGVIGIQPGDRCLRVTTGDNLPGNGYARFDATVSFRILD